jgi:Co/Zn/Cd efflux system component
MHFYMYVGGFISNSTAVITDAAHMAIDVTSFLISLTAMYLARKRPTRKLSFGYIRAGLYILKLRIFIFLNDLLLEVLGALVSVLTIWLVTGVLVYMAVERCIDQSFHVNSLEMIIVASCGVVFNIV